MATLAQLEALEPPVVSRHDIAGIWVAFFSRCQRYRCRQVYPGHGPIIEDGRERL